MVYQLESSEDRWGGELMYQPVIAGQKAAAGGGWRMEGK